MMLRSKGAQSMWYEKVKITPKRLYRPPKWCFFAVIKNNIKIPCNPGNSNSDNSNSPANSNWVSIPLDLTQLFSHFYSVNSNSDKSKTPLTRISVFKRINSYDFCKWYKYVLLFHEQYHRLSMKNFKSNHLHMSLQRQHFLLSYLKTQSVGPAGILNSVLN